ncbi:putative calcium-binding CML50 -like protein [Tripterygium wilfordii]|uniref:Putative calcium-binding CML50 -like protein n=1 Tax=Tripterygium wilfordii TaxID=458696 RepID=A0A7J7DVA7_TRIWF|nr:calcium-binding protein CBP-like [Tripterygium wilfordii]KAF5750247.1 putative calcium-binding CML50 -like protein [Tripterygium wilfordii]
MSGYPQPPPGYGYGAPSQPYTQNPYAPQQHPPYGAPTPPYAAAVPVGEKPHKDKPQSHGGAPPYSSGGAPPYSSGGAPPYTSGGAPPYASGGAPPYSSGGAPPYAAGGYPPPPQTYGSPFATLVPSAFPPGTDPTVVACFQMADQDGSGLIDDKELQSALSSYNQSFSLRTVHLLMYLFTNTNTRKIGPKEFSQLFYSLQTWRSTFDRFDRDRSGKIDANELREALLSMGFAVSPVVLDLLVSKFDKTGGKNKAIEYDNFIECCLTVKGLTEKFKEKDTSYSGSATFAYEAFMLTVLPFLIA